MALLGARTARLALALARAAQPFSSASAAAAAGLPPNVQLDEATQHFMAAQAAAAAAAAGVRALGPPPLRLPVLALAHAAAEPPSAAREVALDPRVFLTEVRRDIVHRVVVWQEQKARRTLYKAKDRSEVRGGGKKPWAQKGLGRARASSIRSPLWKGGGVAHPPKLRHWGTLLQVKVRRLGMRIALAAKFLDRRLLVVDRLALPPARAAAFPDTATAASGRSRDAAASLWRLGIADGTRVLFIDEGQAAHGEGGSAVAASASRAAAAAALATDGGESLRRQSRREADSAAFAQAVANLPRVKVLPQLGANVRDILQAERVVICEAALPLLVNRITRDM